MNKYLQDINFLKEICAQQNQEIFGRVYSLDKYDNIVKDFTGIVQSGSINLDGSSAIRRTCQLTILIKNFNFSDTILDYNMKIKIEIGLKNFTNKYLENEIIWFPMGVYYLTDFTMNKTLQGNTISLSAKDKMIKLTGDLGGTFNSTVDFGTINVESTEQTGIYLKKKIKLKTIIEEMVHNYGQEPYNKIFIYDLDDYGLNTISYCGEDPIYIFLKEKDNEFIVVNYIFDNDYEVKDLSNNSFKLSAIDDELFFVSKYNILGKEQVLKEFYLSDDTGKIQPYYIKKCNSGDIVGYELTELVYNDDLIAAPGENVTSVLNKILNMLGKDNYEYFYDLEGNFVFKKQDQFVRVESYLNPFVSFQKPSICFNHNELVPSVTESFDLSKIKNDFTVWGTKKGSDTQFHVRIAIDKKPESYISLDISEEMERELKKKYPDLYSERAKLQQPLKEYRIDLGDDWREIIYQMAQDYKKFSHLPEFQTLVEEANPQYVNGITGYERYYTDLDGFWRELYAKEPDEITIDQELSENMLYTVDLTDPIVYFGDPDDDNKKITLKRSSTREISNRPYDIISNSLKNQTVYRQRANQDGFLYYEPLGDLNSIIATNYKILKYIYLVTNRYNDEDYLITEDIDTGKQTIWNAAKQNLLWLVDSNIDISTSIGLEKMDNINNKIWKYLKKDTLEPEILGNYYDITSLYIAINENIQYSSNFNSSSSIVLENSQLFTPSESVLFYKKIEKYPTNKDGGSLTNIQDFSKDINGLILWGQANNQLKGINKDIDQTTGYNKKIYDDPANLIFWFDFLDDVTFAQAHSISRIGPREYVQSKSIASSVVNSFILDNIFLNYSKSYTKDEDAIKIFYKSSFAQRRKEIPFFRLSIKDNPLFKMALNTTSAIDLINNYIYNYNYMASQVSIKSIAQYFLQPNSLFEIADFDNKNIIQYIANKISFSFGTTPNILMTINGVKLVDFNYVQQDLRRIIIDE